MTYKIVRFYFSGKPKTTIETGLTLEEAQTHCKDPETSYSRCKSKASKDITKRNEPWFDGYEEE